MSLIVIDAGHGDPYPGATGSGLVEADVTLSVAWKMAKLLNVQGHTVSLTRPFRQGLSDLSVPRDLRLRAELANRVRGVRFLSIHCNAFADPSANGFEVWYHRGSKPGETFSGRVREAMAASLHDMRDRGIHVDRERYRSGFQVLRQTAMPAVLVEIGFLTSPEDAEILGSDQGQWRIAESLAYAADGELRAA